MNAVLIAFTLLLALKTLAELALEALNRRRLRAIEAGEIPPPAVADDEATFLKSVRYTCANSRFDSWNAAYSACVLAAVVLTGLLPALFYALASDFGAQGAWGYALAIVALLWLLGIFEWPWEWAHTFVLEERFGFNKSTQKTWWGDKLKGLLVTLVLGVPALALVLWIAGALPLWWLWAWAALTAIQLLLLVLYPRLILPLFNKLSPLPDGELKTALLALAERTGFRASTIQVIDGSRRSGHSNAFFTGFGKFRRIVLFDTLIAQLSTEELCGVLAHEIGHYRRGHVPRMMVVSSLMMLAGLFAVDFLSRAPWFLKGFGFAPETGIYAALPVFILCAELVTFWVSPLMNMWSRKHEYEADAFAKDALNSPAPLAEALRKLHAANLSNPAPHPLYSFVHYSHPTLAERLAALTRNA